MRVRSLAAALVVLATAAPAAQAGVKPITKSSLLSLSGLGGIGIGVKVSTAERRTGQDLHYHDGQISKGCGVGTLRSRKLGVVVLGTNFRIGYVEVSERGIKTPSGIRVGDSQAKLKRTYGDRLVPVANAYDVNETDFEFRQGSRKLVFFVDPKSFKINFMRAGRVPEVDYIEGCA